MKVMTVLGTRPEIIRLSRVIETLDRRAEHVLVHTGQNYDTRLNDIFFEQLGVRAPDHFLGAQGDLGTQLGTILTGCEQVIREFRPDRFLILGDTNSGLAAIVAKRLGVPVYHMEAGNRCYDDRVPEEVNRRIIDHVSDVLMPYTERSRQNLIREGVEGERIFVTGNPILEVIQHYDAGIAASTVLNQLKLEPRQYFLVTLHRAENVDVPSRLDAVLQALGRLSTEYKYPVIVSTHPRTRHRLGAMPDAVRGADIRLLEPFAFFDFIALERNAFCVLSDSGTVQEECALFGVPNVTLRDVTERPETLECGSNILSGVEPEAIGRCVSVALANSEGWTAPPEYRATNVSDVVTRIVLGYRDAGR